MSYSKNPIPEYALYEQLPLDEIKPKGWIKTFLDRQIKGLTGNIHVSGYPFNTNMWNGETLNRHTSHESNDWWCGWWPYEQTSYFLDGANRVANLTGDENLLKKVKGNIDFVLNHTDENGRIGTKLTGECWRWPYASFNRLFMTEYDLNKVDKKRKQAIVDMLHKHYLTFTAENFADDLELANVEQLCWLYGITKDEKLIQIAEEAYKLFKSDIKYRDRGGNDLVFGSDRVPDNHGVVYIELLKVPALLYAYTGKEEYWNEAINGLNKMEEHFMLVSGLPSTTEHFAKRSDLAGHETCNTATYPYTYGYFLRINGDSTFADRIERAMFNASMGSITKDFKSHQYFSAPNQVISTFDSNRFGYYNGFDCYLPGQKVECCTGNVNRFMPYYIEQMYLRSKDGGIAASLYGPSELHTKISENSDEITIIQETNYPFSDVITFKFECKEEVSFPFYVRIPKWCKNPAIRINDQRFECETKLGEFANINRKFNNGDIIKLHLPMDIEITNQAGNGLTVERGPLIYSLPIEAEEKVVIGYPKSTKDFPAIERRPKSEWKYALFTDLLNKDTIEFNEKEICDYPWDLKNVPFKITVPVQRVLNWQLDEKFNEHLVTVIKSTPAIPEQVVCSNEIEYVDLVPYGSTTLRMTILPKTTATNFIEEKQTTETVVY